LHRALQGILEISFLIPRLKVITFVPRAGLGSGDKSLDRLIRTKYQSNNQSQWVLRLIKTKPSCNPARINPEHWRESREYEEQKTLALLRRGLSQETRTFREKNLDWNPGWEIPAVLVGQSYMARVKNPD
jgi:hypothetical protein